jgi:hypothetical protein
MDKSCGLDVPKDSIFACISDEQGKKNLEKRYGTLTPELGRLRDTLIEQDCGRVASNPYFIKQLPGRKSDVKDAHGIAQCLQKEQGERLLNGSEKVMLNIHIHGQRVPRSFLSLLRAVKRE